MQHGAIEVVRQYAEAVFRRAREPMEPPGFEVDWADQPSRHKTYPDAVRVPLATDPPRLTTLRDLLTGPQRPAGGWTLDRLATLLRLSYGVLDRRLAVNWNQDIAKRVHFPHAVWGRATASGGGMYPVEIYLVAGPSGPLLPGVYHYATGHHALERLLVGDVTPVVRDALGAAADGTDHYLLLSIRFWKNSFKYNTFCYHVVTQDLGALLGSWDLLARAIGAPLRRVLSFDPGPLDDLLGLDGDAESVFAVVPLHWADDETPEARAAAGPERTAVDATAPSAGRRPEVPRQDVEPSAGATPGPRVRHVAFERSRRVLSFPQVTAVHRAAMAPVAGDAPQELRAAAVADLSGTPTPLPPPELDRLDQPLSTVLRARQSSFGRFRRPPELTVAEVGTTLAFAATGGRYPADVTPSEDGPGLTRLWVFANHVAGLAPGAYAYRAADHALLPADAAPPADMAAFLQQRYFLTNYAMTQVGAVIAITGRLEAVLAACGPRGYRILNAEVGTVAQYVYCAATAQGLGCGAVLGFDNVAMNEALGIDATDERTLLFLLLGRQPDHAAELVYQL
jgi:SagB-type dehydrogenase domain